MMFAFRAQSAIIPEAASGWIEPAGRLHHTWCPLLVSSYPKAARPLPVKA